MIAPAKPAIASGSIARHAERPLQLLVVASILLPILIFATTAFISYDRHFAEARYELERKLDTIYEHSLRVFDTFNLAARYVTEITSNVSDDEIRRREAELNARLKALTDTLPQLRDIWLVGADGRPLVAGTVYPIPRDLDLSDREYFKVHAGGRTGNYITEVLQARAADLRFFSITRPRTPAPGNAFNGVTVISAAPEYFTDFYAKLLGAHHGYVTLLRKDGAVLALYPASRPEISRLPEDSPLLNAVRENGGGVMEGRSPIDRKERIFAFRKIPEHEVYITASVDKDTVVMSWLTNMASHLAFGIPATIALFILSLVALRRTRRASVAHDDLQQEIKRREVTEEALRQAQKMEAVGRLTGGVAHDFNNLLTAILGNVDLALRRVAEDDDRVRRLLGSARQACERAATLVQRLLAFSRQHPQEVKAVDINRLVQGMSELLRRTIGETVTVETVLGGGLWKVAADPNQLENAILNLAVNSRDAMSTGGRLTIETSNTYLDEHYLAAQGGDLSPGQYVLLAISDSGLGMSKETIDRAFEPFFTTKPSGAGTGLGLSMVYGFVKQSGGHIKIYSEVNEGTTIKLYFPRLPDESGIEAWRPPEPEKSAPEQSPELADTILLVEDDEEVNRFSTEVLKEEGYHVISTHEAASGLRLLDANPNVKLLFTDVVLPGGMNGRQLADEAQRRRPSLKVLFATGYTRNAIIHQGRLDPDVELLTKPFTADVLARKVKQILEQKSPLEAIADEIKRLTKTPSPPDQSSGE